MTIFQQTFVVDSIETTRLERTVLRLSPIHNGLHRNELVGPGDKAALSIDIASSRRPELGPGQRIDLNIALCAAQCEATYEDHNVMETLEGVAVRLSHEYGRDKVINELRDAINAVEELHRRTDNTGLDESLRHALTPFRGTRIVPTDLCALACTFAGVKTPDFLPDNPTGFTPSGDPVRDLEFVATKLSELQGVEATKTVLQVLLGRCDHALSRGTPAIGMEAEHKRRAAENA